MLMRSTGEAVSQDKECTELGNIPSSATLGNSK